MSKTFRELSAVTPVVSTHIVAVSREDTPFAFKTDIDDIKDYILTSGGTIAVFSHVITQSLRTDELTLSAYVNSTTEAVSFSGAGLAVDQAKGLTTGTTYMDIGTVFNFSVASSVVAKIDSGGIYGARFKGIVTTTTYIDLTSTAVEFYVTGVLIAEIDVDGLVLELIRGRTVPTNYVQFDGPGGALYIVANNNLAISCLPTGEVEMPKRNVISAWANLNQVIPGSIQTKILFANESVDLLNQYNPATSTFTSLRAGQHMQFTIQLSFAYGPWLNSEYVNIIYVDAGTPAGFGSIYPYQASYRFAPTFTGYFISTTTADRFFYVAVIRALPATITTAHLDICILN